MSRKGNASKRLIARFFVLLFSVYLFVPIAQPSSAQVNECPGNIVVNGNFISGLAPWTAAYRTPDWGPLPACHDPGSVGMWGNRNSAIGEGLQQAVSFVQGKIYVGSICLKLFPDPGKQQYAIFRLRASAMQETSWGTSDTIYVSPIVTSITFQPYSFTFTVPSNTSYLTINVENNSNVNDGAMTSYGNIDNVCIREWDFPLPTKICQGQTTAFTGPPGATSYDWDFGDGTPHSTLQNPTHIYANSGTYPVKLCVNVNGTTNCVTKSVTVSAAPPIPVISGLSNLCGASLTQIYSVVPTGGVAYSWSVSNGTINGPSTGTSVNVTWNTTGGGAITVIATNKAGCSSVTRFPVENCDPHLGECCLNVKFQENSASFMYGTGGTYNFTPNISISGSVIRVTADLISSSLTYSPASCGVSGPDNGYMVSAANAVPFTGTVTTFQGHEAMWWYAAGASVNNMNFPMQIHFPLPPSSLGCADSLSFCIKYTYTDRNCRTCEVIRCYGPFKRGGRKIEDPTKNQR